MEGLEGKFNAAHYEYDFAKEGGAIGDITLRGDSIPKNATILGGYVDVETALTSGGSATIALKFLSAADILAATAVASWSLAAYLAIKPLFTTSTFLRMTSGGYLKATVAVDTITAGKANVTIFWDMSRS
jgi:hypothetical protein